MKNILTCYTYFTVDSDEAELAKLEKKFMAIHQVGLAIYRAVRKAFYNTFLESADYKLECTSRLLNEETIETEVFIFENVFNKHIGHLVKEAREKEITSFLKAINIDTEKIELPDGVKITNLMLIMERA